MGLFSKKCEYCKMKIEKGKEIKREVKVPGYVGTYPKNFCSEEHVVAYELEVEKYNKKAKKGRKSCCG
jgi:hypothetical protein